MSAAEQSGEDAQAGAPGAPGTPGVLRALQHTMTLLVDRLNEEKERAPCLPRESTGRAMWAVQRRVTLDVLLVCWGLGTWLGVNGLYVQLPLLVDRLPEGWALPSSMVMAVQFANSGVIVYALLKRLLPHVSDAPYIYGLLAVGTAALALNAFLYTETAEIGGSERSITFLALTFFAALVGCTSSVLFYPYLRHFRDIYLTTYLVGEGLSGFVPGIIALIQGVGGEPECVPSPNNSTVMIPVLPPPLFNTTVFLMLLAALSALSLTSFVVVENWPTFRSERVQPAAAAKEEEAVSPRQLLTQPAWIAVLTTMACLNAIMIGALNSVQSYSCMPYGNRAYHLAVTLSAMANPAVCLASVWLAPMRVGLLAAMLAATAVPLAYIMATALLSPSPPLQHTVGGEVLVVLAWLVVSGSLSYARMWVYGWARRGGAAGMRAVGAVGQVGSSLGSLLFFFLVNFMKIFTQPERCPVTVS